MFSNILSRNMFGKNNMTDVTTKFLLMSINLLSFKKFERKAGKTKAL